MNYSQIHLTLMRSKADPPLESSEYQSALTQFSMLLPKSLLIQQTSFAMDSISGGGGLIGEFILVLTTPLISSLGIAAAEWFKGSRDRGIRLQDGDIKIEVDNQKDLDAALAAFLKIREESHKQEEQV